MAITMKIKLIHTGGTIGSTKKGGIIEKGVERSVSRLWLERTGSDINFISSTPFSVLSENLSLVHWQKLICELDKDYKEYDGIIITHGSDTLSYTSAMVSIYCRDFDIPVVLTGSNKVLSHPESNGIANFEKSVNLIAQGKIGVWTVFDNIYPAGGIMEADCATDRFSLGIYPREIYKIPSGIKLEGRVHIIKEYPFADYSMVNFAHDVKAVLLIGYHSGTANERGASLLLDKCRDKGIPLYLQGLKKGAAMYSSADSLTKKGVIPLYDMTPEYAFAYLTFKVNCG